MIKECSPQIPWKHMDIEQMTKQQTKKEEIKCIETIQKMINFDDVMKETLSKSTTNS